MTPENAEIYADGVADGKTIERLEWESRQDAVSTADVMEMVFDSLMKAENAVLTEKICLQRAAIISSLLRGKTIA